MRCPSCGYWFDPTGGPYVACHACGKPFSITDMIGENGVINTEYEAAKMDWRHEVAKQWDTSGLPYWQCKLCKKTYDTPEPRHLVCQECISGE